MQVELGYMPNELMNSYLKAPPNVYRNQEFFEQGSYSERFVSGNASFVGCTIGWSREKRSTNENKVGYVPLHTTWEGQ